MRTNQQVSHWVYRCAAGQYYNVSLFGLIWDILTHRAHHWRQGDGWID